MCEGGVHMHMPVTHVQARVSKLVLFAAAAREFCRPSSKRHYVDGSLQFLRVFACVTMLVIFTASSAERCYHQQCVTQWHSALQRTIRKLSIANQISSRYFSLLHIIRWSR